MPHDIGPAPKNTYKKGDRVQHIGCGLFATVVEDQTDPLIITINWDERPEGPQDYRADAFAVAPWHGINFKEYFAGVKFDPDLMTLTFPQVRSIIADPTKFYGGAVKADAADKSPYQPGDRVKLKYNRSCGTVVKVNPNGRQVSVRWDKRADDASWEKVDDLVTLYAPRDTDPVNPNQEAIDAIEVQRQVLIKEVDAVQARLRTLTMAKKLLERG